MSDNGTLESRTLKEVKKMGHNPIAISIVDGEEAFVFQTKEESEIAEEDFAPEGVYFSKDEFEKITSEVVYSLIEKPKPKKKPVSRKKPISEDFDGVEVMKIKKAVAGKHSVHKVALGGGKGRAFKTSGLKSKEAEVLKMMLSGTITKTVKDKAIDAVKESIKGRVFVFTGFRDDRIKDAIEDAGGTVIPRVRATATDLIMKKKGTGTAKEVQARKYGLNIMTINEFNESTNAIITKVILDTGK